MSSLSVALPLSLDASDGFKMNKNFRSLAKQNLKMLILTHPGERVMDPEFGVGVKTLLFNNFTELGLGDIDTRIREQVNFYMPMITIRDIRFFNISPDTNSLALRIEYSVPEIGVKDLLEFTI